MKRLTKLITIFIIISIYIIPFNVYAGPAKVADPGDGDNEINITGEIKSDQSSPDDYSTPGKSGGSKGPIDAIRYEKSLGAARTVPIGVLFKLLYYDEDNKEPQVLATTFFQTGSTSSQNINVTFGYNVDTKIPGSVAYAIKKPPYLSYHIILAGVGGDEQVDNTLNYHINYNFTYSDVSVPADNTIKIPSSVLTSSDITNGNLPSAIRRLINTYLNTKNKINANTGYTIEDEKIEKYYYSFEPVYRFYSQLNRGESLEFYQNGDYIKYDTLSMGSMVMPRLALFGVSLCFVVLCVLVVLVVVLRQAILTSQKFLLQCVHGHT